MTKKIYYTAEDVSKVLCISKTTAYRIIHRLNDELKRGGYITVSGRVPKTFFDERFYSNDNRERAY